MKYMRLFAGSDGESHIEEVEAELAPVEYAPPAPPIDISAPVDTAATVFVRFPAGWESDWHVSPRRQLLVILSGELTGTASDGKTLALGPGGVLAMEDTHGKGHLGRVTSGGDVLTVMVQLE
jgi:quercetin dioxygenase-like cupin family protein